MALAPDDYPHRARGTEVSAPAAPDMGKCSDVKIDPKSKKEVRCPLPAVEFVETGKGPTLGYCAGHVTKARVLG